MRHRPSESHNFALLEVRQLHLSWRCRLVLMAGLGRRGDLGEELCQLALYYLYYLRDSVIGLDPRQVQVRGILMRRATSATFMKSVSHRVRDFKRVSKLSFTTSAIQQSRPK